MRSCEEIVAPLTSHPSAPCPCEKTEAHFRLGPSLLATLWFVIAESQKGTYYLLFFIIKIPHNGIAQLSRDRVSLSFQRAFVKVNKIRRGESVPFGELGALVLNSGLGTETCCSWDVRQVI